MALQIDTVVQACNLISREIRDFQKSLNIHYVVHHSGQRTEALALAGQEIASHPAAETAQHFLQKPRKSEDSTYLGTAVAQQKIFFGLTTKDNILSLCTINVDQMSSLKEVRRQAYHLAWHALDSVEYHSNPRHRSGNPREIIVRKRNVLELAAANLSADIFAAAMGTLHGDRDAVKRLGLARGLAALNTRSLHNPEFYPFAMAMEATSFALDRVDMKAISKKKLIPTALKITREVSRTFDEINLKSWLAFAEPAQEMAWRGFSEAEIISAAINTSKNTYIRALSYMISEIAEIKPASIIAIKENYSPFADDEFNEKLHEKIVDQIFQDVIAQGVKQDSAIPFLTMAHQQNHALTEGKTIGWCASALQSAGVIYNDTKERGPEAEVMARNEFTEKKQKTNWDDLKALGKRITKEQRQGSIVTMSDLEDISKDLKGLRDLRQSVEKTLEDPQYKQKLAAANELTPENIPAPKTPELRATPKVAPVTPAPATPGLGIPGLGAARKTTTVPPQQQTAPQKQTQKDDDKGEAAQK